MKMNRTNTAGRILALLLTALMVLSLAACGTKGGDKMDGMSSEPKNAEEAVAMHKELMAQENAILSEDTALWGKGFHGGRQGHDLCRRTEKLRRVPAGYHRECQRPVHGRRV